MPQLVKGGKNYKQARKKLEGCVVNALDRGLTRDEIFAGAERYLVEGMPFCNVIILNEILNYERDRRQPPIDIVKERKSEMGDV